MPPLNRPAADALRLEGLHASSALGNLRTLHEIKVAAATLAAEERSELVAWLVESKDVWEIRRAQLRREIQIGLDEIERG